MQYDFFYLNPFDISALNEIAGTLDELGYFPTTVYRRICRNAHFQLFVRRSLDGLQLDLVPAAYLIEEYAYIDGNIGWIVQIGAGGGIFSAYLDPEVGAEFFSEEHQVIAGSDFVGGEAVPSGSGYLVSGQWRYASGSFHATAFTGNVKVREKSGEERIAAFIVPAGAVKISPTWNAMGMRATDSHSFSLKEQYVSARRLFTLTPADLRCPEIPLYRIPFLIFARAVFLPVLIGVAIKYSTLYDEMLDRKNLGIDTEAARAGRTLNRSLEKWRDSFYQKTEEISELAAADGDFEEPGKAYAEFCIEMTTRCVEWVSACHRHTGMEGVRMDTAINAVYRNLVTASAHYLLSPGSRLY